MGKGFDDLLCFLLEEIALCGNQGIILIAPQESDDFLTLDYE